MNYMNDSRELHVVESICSGKLSHVPSQPAFVPSPGGMLRRDPSLRLDTWNLLEFAWYIGKRFLLSTFSNRFVTVTKTPVREAVARSEERNEETIPTPRFARRPSTTNSFSPAQGGYPQKYMADQTELQISKLQFDNVIDNFDYSETSTAIFQNESVDVDTELSCSGDAELDDEIIGKALSSPLFTQEREESANRRQAYHSHEESLLPAQSFFAHTSTERPVYELSSNLSQKRK